MWSGLRNAGRALLLVLLLCLVLPSGFTQEDVETMTTVELIDEALRLLAEQEQRLESREASLEQRENNLNRMETSLLRIEQVSNDFENYSKSLESANDSLELWNNILIGTTVASLITTGLVIWLR